jgi:hypothetical protein
MSKSKKSQLAGGVSMKWRSWFPACAFSALIGVSSSVDADDALDKALKVLAKGWSGHGGGCVLSDAEGKTLGKVSYTFLQCQSKPYFFIAAIDLSLESSDSGPVAEGAFTARPKQRIRWSCETLDAKKGIVRVGDQKFKLEDGAAFWLFRKGERWEVYQTKVPGGVLQQASESQSAGAPFTVLKAVAKSEKALAEYARSVKLKVE